MPPKTPSKTPSKEPKTPSKGGNKWSAETDRDLMLAMLAAQGAVNPKWASVNQIMEQLGYSFTDGAISQRWSKTIFKKFREQHSVDKIPGAHASATATATPRRKSAAAGKKRTAGELFQEDGDATPAASAAAPAPLGTPLPVQLLTDVKVEVPNPDFAHHEAAQGPQKKKRALGADDAYAPLDGEAEGQA